MKVSGAVAMADDPEHAFGEGWHVTSQGTLEPVEIDPATTECIGKARRVAISTPLPNGDKLVRFDMDPLTPSEASDPDSKWVEDGKVSFDAAMSDDHESVVGRIFIQDNAENWASVGISINDVDWMLLKLTEIKARLAP